MEDESRNPDDLLDDLELTEDEGSDVKGGQGGLFQSNKGRPAAPSQKNKDGGVPVNPTAPVAPTKTPNSSPLGGNQRSR